MRCKSCTYPLWKLKARQCPECGSAFKPSEFEFIRNSVKFCCPHCDQPYFGDDPVGRLWPIEFDCVHCGRHIHMDEMVLAPAAGLAEERTEARKMPWLERRTIGIRRAWFRTVGMALVSPGELMELTPDDSSLLDAVKFWVLTQGLIWIAAALPLWAVMGVGMATAASGRGGSIVGPLAISLGAIFGGGLVASFLLTLIFGLIAHALLFLTGRTDAGLRRTMQAMAYSAGANVLTAIPCLGGYIGWIWWLVSATIMVRAGHRVKAWRAVVAVVAPVAAAIAIFIGGYAAFVWIAIQRAGPALASANIAATGSAPAAQRAASLAKAIAAAPAGAPDPVPPLRHIAELIATGAIEPGWVIDVGSGGMSKPSLDSIKVGPLTYMEFVAADTKKKTAAALAASAALPADAAAYRFGDFIFTYPNRDRLSPEKSPAVAALWDFVEWPRGATPMTVQISLLDGSRISVNASKVDEHLAKQNELRAQFGLAPLPHPSTFDPPGLVRPDPDLETSPLEPRDAAEPLPDPD